MITIHIENAEKIVKQEKGFLVSKLAPYFIDIQAKVEQAIAEECYSYDGRGNLISSKESLLARRKVTYEYNALGQETLRNISGGHIEQRHYDEWIPESRPGTPPHHGGHGERRRPERLEST